MASNKAAILVWLALPKHTRKKDPTMDEYKDLRNDIGLDENSKVLLFSTEGDTDPDRYKNIVWKGLDK